MAKKSLPKSRRKQPRFSLMRWSFKWCFVAGIWGGIALFLMLIYFALDLPPVAKIEDDIATRSIEILDHEGIQVAYLGGLYKKKVTYEEMPQTLIDAVTSIEDRRFFDHMGVDPIGLVRAAFANYKADKVVQGGSTITQQLAKITFLTPARNLKRKIQEMILAFLLERRFSKKEIFTTYMNRIYLGAGNYGVGAAAKYYFGKEVHELNLYESAMIAGLIKAPSRYSPTNDPKLTADRTNQVLMSMYDNDKVTAEQLAEQDLALNKQKIHYRRNVHYPYYIQWIKEQLPDYLAGINDNVIIETSFDSHLQDIAEEVLVEGINRDRENHKVTQGAMVVMSPDGAVLAVVGGVDYNTSEFNRAIQALRQPGSSFKLFVYLAALEQGYEPTDRMVDEPIQIGTWTPQNWNNRFVGEVPLHNALANSINTIAVKLTDEIGVRRVIEMAARLGIKTKLNMDLSSALGTSEVTLLDLTGAYAHIPNQGKAVWTHGIKRIVDEYGNEIYVRKATNTPRVLDQDVVTKMNDMLTRVVNGGTGRRAYIRQTAGGKTGTSQDERDAWFIGYTKDYVVGVWVGNDNNTPMRKMGGGNLPADIWKAFMERAYEERETQKTVTYPNGSSAETQPESESKPGSGGFWKMWKGMFE